MKMNPLLMIEGDLLANADRVVFEGFLPFAMPVGLQQPCDCPDMKYRSHEMQPPQSKVATSSNERSELDSARSDSLEV